MSRVISFALAKAGYNLCPAAREERADNAPRTRPVATATTSAIRDNIRKNVLLHVALLAMPVNDWRRDQLELGRAVALNRYRLALSALMAERRPRLPDAIQSMPAAIAAE